MKFYVVRLSQDHYVEPSTSLIFNYQ